MVRDRWGLFFEVPIRVATPPGARRNSRSDTFCAVGLDEGCEPSRNSPRPGHPELRHRRVGRPSPERSPALLTQ